MRLVGNVDECGVTELRGWVADADNPEESLILLGLSEGAVVAATVASWPRPDLAKEFANTKKGFWLDLTATTLSTGTIELRAVSARALGVDPGQVFSQVRTLSSLERSQARWRGSEDPLALTWGIRLSGKEFFETVAHTLGAKPKLGRVVEIGPGAGRLLSHVLEEKMEFSSYLGLDISADRVRQLTDRFGSPNVSFVVADVLKHKIPEFDTLICSSTIEHLYPNAQATINNVGAAVAPGGHVFIDFLRADSGSLEAQAQGFARGSGEFVRYYGRSEVDEMYRVGGLSLVNFEPFDMTPTEPPRPGYRPSVGRIMAAGIGIGLRATI